MSFDTRNSLLAKVHIAKAQLKLDDDAYRAVLSRFGAASAKDMDMPGLEKLLHHFEKLGWHPTPGRSRKKDTHGEPKNLARNGRKGAAKPYDRSALMTKIEALLAEKGAQQGSHVPWSYAHAIAKRMYKVDRLEFATAEQLRGVMVALMQGGKRKGGKVFAVDEQGRAHVLKYRGGKPRWELVDQPTAELAGGATA